MAASASEPELACAAARVPSAVVLVVEDELPLRKLLRVILSSRGYRVIDAATAQQGIEHVTAYRPDVVLLDLGLPDRDGIEVIEIVREQTRTPIVAMSAGGRDDRMREALDRGADDYVMKPCVASEILDRVRLALQYGAQTGDCATTIVIGTEITLDLTQGLVLRNGRRVALTQTEVALLVRLAEHAGMVRTYRQLLGDLGEPRHPAVERLRTCMATLRHKLEARPAQPRYLCAEPGIGYRLRIDA